MDKKILIALNSILVAFILIFNFLYFREEVTIFSTLNILAALIFASPIIFIKYTEHKRRKELEDHFPAFLRDFVETIRGGMTVPQAFKSVALNDYASLTPFVKKMCAQLDWGIPVEKVLLKFSKETKSRFIARLVSSVIESHRFGGNLADTFEALSNTALEIEKLRAERRLYLHSQMITGYIIFFVFLGVIIGLEKFLVPGLAQVSPTGLAGPTALTPPEAQETLALEYRTLFRNLILLQGLFAGLAVGKMAEGAIVAGLKHSLFMMFVGFVVFTLVG